MIERRKNGGVVKVLLLRSLQDGLQLRFPVAFEQIQTQPQERRLISLIEVSCEKLCVLGPRADGHVDVGDYPKCSARGFARPDLSRGEGTPEPATLPEKVAARFNLHQKLWERQPCARRELNQEVWRIAAPETGAGVRELQSKRLRSYCHYAGLEPREDEKTPLKVRLEWDQGSVLRNRHVSADGTHLPRSARTQGHDLNLNRPGGITSSSCVRRRLLLNLFRHCSACEDVFFWVFTGGLRAKPGEASLAHNGVLFLDELPEYSAQALDSLRQPLETGEIVVARANAHVRYPARFQLVAAMNPCRCGLGGAGRGACGKAPRCQRDYQNRISGPMFDRIDLTVETPPVTAADMALPPPAEGTAEARARVAVARAMQEDRVRAAGLDPAQALNARASGEILDRFATPDEAGRMLLMRAGEAGGLTARGWTRTLRLARTIADLEGATGVLRRHIAEALIYRRATLGAEADFDRSAGRRGDAPFGLRDGDVEQTLFTHDGPTPFSPRDGVGAEERDGSLTPSL